MKRYFLYIIIIIGIYLGGCSDKMPTEGLGSKSTGNITGDTLYIQTGNAWTGFNKPQDILIGKEPFIYVADTENDRIVMLNLNGEILGTKQIKHPVALAQDYKLNLIVCAQFDTTVNGVTTTYSAVYKINMKAASHQIGNASVRRILPRPADLSQPLREYSGVTVFYNNQFIVARRGPNNSSIFDPDNSILMFSPSGDDADVLIGRVPNIDAISSGLVSANQISSLTAFNKRSTDFVMTLTGQNSFKTQWLQYVVSPIDEKYESHFSPSDGVEFTIPGKFLQPEDAAIDNAGNVFVADAGKDSIYKFNAFGDEMESFGGPEVFNSPYAVAVFNNIVYIADTGNDRVIRFTLSTDVQ